MRSSGLALLFLAGSALAADDLGELRGVSLLDIRKHETSDLIGKDGVANLAGATAAYWASQPAASPIKLKKNVAISFYSIDTKNYVFTADVLGSDPRFKGRKNALGFLRVAFDFYRKDETGKTPRGVRCLGTKKDPTAAVICVKSHRLVEVRDFADVSPEITVSLSTRHAVLMDSRSGFHRSWPLEVSALDQVRFPGKTTLMTPVEENAWLHADASIPKRKQPYYYDDEPFVRVVIPGTVEKDGVVVPELRKNGEPQYRWSPIGFHIFQNREFIRGFDSHGCMRMRREDLRELMLILLSRNKIPLHLRMRSLEEYRHPVPFFEEYFQRVQNFGTPEQPKAFKDFTAGEYKRFAKDLRKYHYIRDLEEFDELVVTEKLKEPLDQSLIDRLEGVSFHEIKKVEATLTEGGGKDGLKKVRDDYRAWKARRK